MTTFRIETIADPESGLIYVEAFHEPDNDPVIKSKPTYATHEEAVADLKEMMEKAWPDRFPFAVDPSIGV